MTVYEILTIVLIVVLATVTTVAIYLGSTQLDRRLSHRAVQHLPPPDGLLGEQPQPSCPHCRHPALTHPLYAAHHPGAPVRVRDDPLKY